jgi:hypothetical protein
MNSEIWKLENAWYAHHCDGTPEKAYALLHDNFLGWPSVDSAVVDKEGLIEFITDEDAEIESCEFEIGNPSDVQLIGDTAVNHYRVQFKGRNLDGSEFMEALHVSHTWIKEDLRWKLLCGMAYEVENT